jgi:putative transposase
MARPLRIEYEGAFYHVTARGNERKRVFFGKADYEAFKGYLKEAKEKYGARLHCYVLMTNHYWKEGSPIKRHPVKGKISPVQGKG